MTLHLAADDVRELATHDVAMAAARAAVEAERTGRAVLPPRLDVDLQGGFLRTMPAAVGEFMGLKVMTLVKGVGNRYLILLYRQETGELIAALDADEVTRLRTAATTAVAGELLAPGGTELLGLIGSGFEAEGHLRTLARLWPLRRVLVFSPSQARRTAFCARMSDELGIAVTPVERMEEAISEPPVSVLATKTHEPVVDGGAFPRGAVVLSIGSTRPDLRELDRATFQRAHTLLVDDVQQVMLESGDVIEALDSGALTPDRLAPLSAPAPVDDRDPERDLLVFKSVGTAVQDLSLAGELFEAASARGRGRDIGELTRLKPFPASTPAPSALPATVEGPR